MANDPTQKHVFTGVFIPAKIWLHPDFTPIEKMMLAEIKALSEDTGWCYAGNAHFAKWLKCSPQNVSNYVSNFKKQGLIDVKFSDEKTHSGRKIRVNLAWYHSIPNPLSPAVPPLSPAVPPLSPAVTDIHFKDTYKPFLEGGKTKNAPTTFDEMIDMVNEQAEAAKSLKPITKPTHIVTTVEAVELPELPKFYQPTNPDAAAKLLSRLEVKPKASTAKEAHEQISAWCAENSDTVQWCYEAARRKQTADDLHARIVDFVGCYSNHETIGKQLNFFSDPAYMFSNGLTKWLQTQNKFDREQATKSQKPPYQQPEQKYTPPQKPTPPQPYYD